MANAWKRELSTPLLSRRTLLLIPRVISVYFLFAFFSSSSSANPNPISIPKTFAFASLSPIRPFNCSQCPQATPVFASVVKGVAHPFLYSLADLGTLPDKPHKNISRMLKGKPCRPPDISVTIQDYHVSKGAAVGDEIVADVGANVGMATFAAAAMGFHVVAFEPVFENLHRLCDGLFLNRAWDRASLFAVAASVLYSSLQNYISDKALLG